MPNCACGRPEGKKGSGVCAICASKGVTSTSAPKKTSLQKKQEEDNARIKLQMAQKLEERQQEMLEMAERAARIQQRADEKRKKIANIAAGWTGKVNTVVSQVKELRKANPDATGINAGTNDAGNTEGGSKNPLLLDLPANDYGITKADVCALMAGFDGSDSAELKIRVHDAAGNILVHIK